MAQQEKVYSAGIKMQPGWLYYFDSGNIMRESTATSRKKEVVLSTPILRDRGFLYFIDKDGDVAKSPMKTGGRKKKPAVKVEDTKSFDFGDGAGPVPAHRHPKGGGWVADTAYVSRRAYLGKNAVVYGNACVFEKVRILGNSQVMDGAQLGGSARISGKSYVCGNAIVSDFAAIENSTLGNGAMIGGNTRLIRSTAHNVQISGPITVLKTELSFSQLNPQKLITGKDRLFSDANSFMAEVSLQKTKAVQVEDTKPPKAPVIIQPEMEKSSAANVVIESVPPLSTPPNGPSAKIAFGFLAGGALLSAFVGTRKPKTVVKDHGFEVPIVH